jgi:hypothetical protein
MQECIPSIFQRGAQMRPFSRVTCIIRSESKALIYDQYEDRDVWLSIDEMDEWIKQEAIEYNKYEDELRISQEEENYAEESEKIDSEITLQRRRVEQIKFEIMCQVSKDKEASKKRKRDEENNEKRIAHAQYLQIKYKNDEIYNIKQRMDENYQILEARNKARIESKKNSHLKK